MTRSELVGYVKKSQAGNALKISILKSSMDNAQIVEGKDGTEFITFIVDLSKIRMIIGEEKEVASVCQLMEE